MSEPTGAAPPGAAHPRMLAWLAGTVLLVVFAHNAQANLPGSLVAVTLYKAHLMALGGWGGYWLDRALFPYSRPHSYIADELTPLPGYDGGELHDAEAGTAAALGAAHDYPLAMLRRAIVVAACLVCVGLGA